MSSLVDFSSAFIKLFLFCLLKMEQPELSCHDSLGFSGETSLCSVPAVEELSKQQCNGRLTTLWKVITGSLSGVICFLKKIRTSWTHCEKILSP